MSISILAAFLTSSIHLPVQAQVAPEVGMPWMPLAGTRVELSPEFTPSHLKGMVIHPDNALQFDFLIHRGDQNLSDTQKQAEYKKLIKYFLASLAVPDEDQWVNLSPYEKDRIIKDDFGKTEMGRDLLAQDYILKQITASLIYPESTLGQKFWDKVYTQAQQQFGTSNVPMNTFNKVWIVPDEAYVYEKGNTVYIVKQHLKVMLEEDYLSLDKHAGISTTKPAEREKLNKLGSQIVREIVLPALEREVNEGKNFAMLRQVYSGMLLAAWYKRALKESLLGKIYANKAKLKGVDQNNSKANQEIYQQYLKAFKKGVFNYIKEDMDKYTKESIPRKYFSGGVKHADYAQIARRATAEMVGSDAAVRDGLLDVAAATLNEQRSLQVPRGRSNADGAMNSLGAWATGKLTLAQTFLRRTITLPAPEDNDVSRVKHQEAIRTALLNTVAGEFTGKKEVGGVSLSDSGMPQDVARRLGVRYVDQADGRYKYEIVLRDDDLTPFEAQQIARDIRNEVSLKEWPGPIPTDGRANLYTISDLVNEYFPTLRGDVFQNSNNERIRDFLTFVPIRGRDAYRLDYKNAAMMTATNLTALRDVITDAGVTPIASLSQIPEKAAYLDINRNELPSYQSRTDWAAGRSLIFNVGTKAQPTGLVVPRSQLKPWLAEFAQQNTDDGRSLDSLISILGSWGLTLKQQPDTKAVERARKIAYTLDGQRIDNYQPWVKPNAWTGQGGDKIFMSVERVSPQTGSAVDRVIGEELERMLFLVPELVFKQWEAGGDVSSARKAFLSRRADRAMTATNLTKFIEIVSDGEVKPIGQLSQISEKAAYLDINGGELESFQSRTDWAAGRSLIFDVGTKAQPTGLVVRADQLRPWLAEFAQQNTDSGQSLDDLVSILAPLGLTLKRQGDVTALQREKYVAYTLAGQRIDNYQTSGNPYAWRGSGGDKIFMTVEPIAEERGLTVNGVVGRNLRGMLFLVPERVFSQWGAGRDVSSARKAFISGRRDGAMTAKTPVEKTVRLEGNDVLIRLSPVGTNRIAIETVVGGVVTQSRVGTIKADDPLGVWEQTLEPFVQKYEPAAEGIQSLDALYKGTLFKIAPQVQFDPLATELSYQEIVESEAKLSQLKSDLELKSDGEDLSGFVGTVTSSFSAALLPLKKAERDIIDNARSVTSAFVKTMLFDTIEANLNRAREALDQKRKLPPVAPSPADRAMSRDLGGIDLNSANLNLQIKRDGKGVPLPVSQQNLESIQIDGFIPVIMSIRPAASLPILSELQTPPAQAYS